ncbi:MAG TPA: insulinase family protein, partial [Gemmatimonadaceae bacterium]
IMHTDTLPNGMQLVVVENHTVPIVTAEIVFRAGAMTQRTDDQGIPHLFEHMLFKSYRGPMGEPFDADAAKASAAYNGATSDEDVLYYLALPSAMTDNALRMLARLVRDPTFGNADFLRERMVVLNEAQRNASDPRFHLDHETGRRLWGAGFPRKNVIGDEQALMAVTVPDLRTIYGRYYVPNNAALIVTGDISAPQVFAMADKHFATWARQPDPFVAHPVAEMPALDSSHATVVTANVTTVTLQIEWQGPSVPRDPRGTYAANVLSDMVNDEQSSFQTRLVDSGLFQEADLTYATRAHVGPITFYGVTTPAKLATALTALATEFGYMESADYFPPAEIAAATKRHAVENVFRVENAHALALDLAETWAVAGTDYFRNYSENIATTTESDLHAFVERYVAHRPFVITALVAPNQTTETATLLREYLGMTAP